MKKALLRVFSAILGLVCLAVLVLGVMDFGGVKTAKAYWEKTGQEAEENFELLENGIHMLKQNETAYTEGVAAYLEGKEDYEAGEEKLAAGAQQLSEGQANYDANAQKLAAAHQAYEENVQKLDAAKAQLEQGKQDLEAGKARVAAGEAELDSSINLSYFFCALSNFFLVFEISSRYPFFNISAIPCLHFDNTYFWLSAHRKTPLVQA